MSDNEQAIECLLDNSFRLKFNELKADALESLRLEDCSKEFADMSSERSVNRSLISYSCCFNFNLLVNRKP